MPTGIERIIITDTLNGSGKDRFIEARKRYPIANALYREIFAKMGIPLLPGETEIECTKDEFMAGYDYGLGIDVILHFENGQSSTLQEKFLFKGFNTVTVEYYQDWRNEIPGDWFNMKAQYYFCGDTGSVENIPFVKWILLDWPIVQRLGNYILWQTRRNEHDGARADFKWAKMDMFPRSCVVDKSEIMLTELNGANP